MKNSAKFARNIFTVVALAGLMVVGPVARAQDKPATAPAPSSDTNAAPKLTRAKQTEAFIAGLKLPDDQTAQFKAALKEETAKIKETNDDTSLARKEKQAKNKEVREATNAKIKGILNPDLYEKWLAFQKQLNGRRGTGKPGQPAPSSPSTAQ